VKPKTEIVVPAKIKIRIPGLPNFLIDDNGNSWPIHAFDSSVLEAVADEWRRALLEKAFLDGVVKMAQKEPAP
jgi:hypothetical protein